MEIARDYSDHGRVGLNIADQEGPNQLKPEVEAIRIGRPRSSSWKRSPPRLSLSRSSSALGRPGVPELLRIRLVPPADRFRALHRRPAVHAFTAASPNAQKSPSQVACIRPAKCISGSEQKAHYQAMDLPHTPTIASWQRYPPQGTAHAAHCGLVLHSCAHDA